MCKEISHSFGWFIRVGFEVGRTRSGSQYVEHAGRCTSPHGNNWRSSKCIDWDSLDADAQGTSHTHHHHHHPRSSSIRPYHTYHTIPLPYYAIRAISYLPYHTHHTIQVQCLFLYHTYHTTPTIQCPPYHTMPHLPYQIIPAIPYHTQHTIPDQTYNIIPTMLSIRSRAPPTHPGRPRLRDGPMGREDAPCRPNGPPRGPKEDPKTQDGPRAQEAPRRPRWLPRRPKT